MIDSFYLWQSFQSFVNTYVGGWFRPQTDFIQSANDISNQLWEDWTKVAEKSQEARDNLIEFLRSKNMLVKQEKSFYGTFAPPKDYGRFASARMYVVDEKSVPCQSIDDGNCANGQWESATKLAEDYWNNVQELSIQNIDNQRWANYTAHKTKGPKMNNPGLTQIDVGFRVAPRDVSVVVLDYYVRPTNATFLYTLTPGNPQTGAGDQIIYNKASVGLQWPTTIINEFLWRLGERYSLFTREQFMTQYTGQQKKTA